MPLHLTFNTHDAEALAAIVGPVPEAIAHQWHTDDEIEPGYVELVIDSIARTVEISDFDPLTAGIILARFSQQNDREALRAWPLTGELDFEGEHFLGLVGCDNDTVMSVAQTYALMTELNKAIEDGAVEIIDLSDAPQDTIDAVSQERVHITPDEPVHPEAETEHGGEG